MPDDNQTGPNVRDVQDGAYPRRGHPVHGVAYDGRHAPIVLVTVCTKNRIPWLAATDVHELLRNIWRDSNTWLVGRYCIRPDHLHLFAGYTGSDISLDRWVRYWKSMFTKQHGNPAHTWQSGHWDRRHRSNDNYVQKWAYVRENPVRHGLVTKSSMWQFAGEVFTLPGEIGPLR